eukprot:Amastigsp_a175054_37.p3 type:complete len:111 gc:universal Amastigsp_a175054_37:667-999(+)
MACTSVAPAAFANAIRCRSGLATESSPMFRARWNLTVSPIRGRHLSASTDVKDARSCGHSSRRCQISASALTLALFLNTSSMRASSPPQATSGPSIRAAVLARNPEATIT